MTDIAKIDAMKTACEKAIAKALESLEIDSGSVVESLEIIDYETTGISDSRKQFERRVRVELKALPGTRWGQV